MEKFTPPCCFCKINIKEKIGELIIILNDEKPESEHCTIHLFCHIPCFTSKLSTKMQHYTMQLNE